MAKVTQKGWIKLFRKIRDNIIWKSNEPYDKRSAWIELLLMANHEPKEFLSKKGKPIKVNPGQCFTSIESLANQWHWSRNKVRRYLRLLDGLGMCHSCGTPDGTLVTIVNYRVYQGERHTDGPSNEPTDEPANGTPYGTPYEPSLGTRTRMYKNDNKNDIRMNQEIKEPASPIFDSGGFIVED